MAIALRQVNQGKTSSPATSLTLGFTMNPLAESLLLLFVAGNTNTFSGASESVGTDIVNSAVGYAGDTTNNVYQGMYYVQGCVGGSTTLQAAFTSATTIDLMVAEYTGVATTAALDGASAVAHAFNSSPTVTSPTPTQSGDLAIALLSEGGASATISSWNSGYMQQENVPSATHLTAYADQILGASGVNGSATLSGNTNWTMSMALFKAASSPPPTGNPSQFFLGASLLPLAWIIRRRQQLAKERSRALRSWNQDVKSGLILPSWTNKAA